MKTRISYAPGYFGQKKTGHIFWIPERYGGKNSETQIDRKGSGTGTETQKQKDCRESPDRKRVSDIGSIPEDVYKRQVERVCGSCFSFVVRNNLLDIQASHLLFVFLWCVFFFVDKL